MAKFYVPPTLAADFDQFLKTNVPNQVGDFILLHDWNDQFNDNYTETVIRGEIYPDSTKSRYENTDNFMNFRASTSSGIRKGDMVIHRDSGKIYLLDWEVSLETNNAPSRALRCNTHLTITRRIPEETDQFGFIVSETNDRIIVNDLPCNAYRYDGRPEFSSIVGTAGISANALTILTIQYNAQTDDIRIDDKFVWGYETYRIVDIDLFGLSINGKTGTLKLMAKKEAGGAVE